MLSNTILIVDDTPNNIRILFDVLNEAEFGISVAKSGEMALEKIDQIRPDLILLDVMMPGINGFETCRRIKMNPAYEDIPIIFMTALADTDHKVSGLQLGAVDYITKPIQVEEVLARVRTQLKLRHIQQQLRQEVSERQQAEAELTQTLKALQQMQLQLVQSEKMSALGKLVAGIAHEINNPVNFIYGNLTHVQTYTSDLLLLIQLYQHNYPNPVADIAALTQKLELDFIRDDLLHTLSSMTVGTERIREIVLSLRNFSRLDESGVKSVDIHEGIESALLILQHHLKSQGDRSAIQIVKDYAPLPLVQCYPAELNQVFMSILSNAIDALEASQSRDNDHLSQITIRTDLLDLVEQSWVQIAIADNGIGMPTAIQNQIFDPFFTTKPVGKGTGMGMSISYKIITEQHQGKLECHSTPDVGTEFIIQIPVQQQ